MSLQRAVSIRSERETTMTDGNEAGAESHEETTSTVRTDTVRSDARDRVEPREPASDLEPVVRLAQSITSELDLKRLIETLNAEAAVTARAQFAVFTPEPVLACRDALYSLAGAPREAFERSLPAADALFTERLHGVAVARLDDLPTVAEIAVAEIASWMAARIVSGTGEPLGRLLVAHLEPAWFTVHDERMLSTVARLGAVAIHNARLFETLRAPDYRHPEPRNFEPRHPEPRNFEPRSPEPRNFEPRSFEPRSFEPRNFEPRNFEPTGEHEASDRPTTPEPRHIETERDALLEGETRARREAERAATEQRLLADASRILASSLELDRTLTRVLDLTIGSLAQSASVHLRRAPAAPLERMASASGGDRSIEERLARFGADGHDPLDMTRVADSVRAAIRHVSLDGETLHAMVVPLCVREHCFGTLALCASDREFGERELGVAEELGMRMAMAVQAGRLYEEAQHERQRAEEANRGKDEFLAMVSHELRTPLNAITGWAKMLRQGTLTPDKQRRAVEVIERNAMVQTQLIEDLLDVSRIIAGKLRIELVPLEISGVIEMAVEAVRPQADAKRVELHADLASDAAVLGDADRLQQVVWNLLTNAVKFTPSGGRVDVRVRREADQVEIAVCDTGSGIRAELLPHVFERFRQADSGRTRTHGGLGLGLTIVRHIVELHTGVIAASSEGEGKGSRFVVRLPSAARVGNRPRITAIARPTLPPTLRSVPRLRGVRVLVVDDERDARDLLVNVFHDLEAEVTAAASAREAFDAFEKARPHVLVSDIGMPGEDGYALIRRIRARDRARGGSIPAIALTAYTAPEDRARALGEGFDRHLTKPVAPSELAIVISDLIETAAESSSADA
jgi:signal transduction histidine kinase/CheY-like chemotaxis protein